MRYTKKMITCSMFSLASFLISVCATFSTAQASQTFTDPSSADEFVNSKSKAAAHTVDYAARIPSTIQTTEKVVIIDPKVHVWGAYDANGDLVRAGLATAGGRWCSDIGRSCRTKVGSFRVASLGSAGCKSSKYPVPRGGAPMPYCMFFNGGQGMHGSYQVVEGNVSHGCVRLHVPDAEWLRFHFVDVGTKVIVKPYY